jgi:hypothetical protein
MTLITNLGRHTEELANESARVLVGISRESEEVDKDL